MTFKSLMIFALFASVGRVMAAPLAAGIDSGAGKPCQGIRCVRYIAGYGHSDLSPRLAEFDGNNVTLSSSSLGNSLTINPSATLIDSSSPTLSVNPSSTPLAKPFFTLSNLPSSTSSVDPGTETPSPSSSTSDGIPQAINPAAGGPVTITVISTIFLNPTDPAASLPAQSPALPNSLVSSSSAISPSPTISGYSSPPISVEPSATLPAGGVSSSPVLIQPSGIFTSVSSPAPLISPTIIDLSQGIPSSSSSVSSSPVGQPTPSPTPGIIFLPPSGDDGADSSP